MKISSKKFFLIGTFLIGIIAVWLFVSLFKKSIFVTGFAYKNDIIRVKQSKITIQTLKVDTNNIDSNRVCSFDETFSYYTFSGNAKLNIEIDSAGHKLLDTILVFTERNKRPFISFQKPTETKFKRKFFVGDETDKGYIKF
jgi:hypothetical protein